MSVEGVFNATASDYDGARRRLIPCYDRFYGAALERLPATAEQVLELGAGTGLFTAMLRTRLPRTRLHLLDVAEGMLVQAQERFAGDGAVTTELCDYAVEPLGTGWDAVVSALSIHHLEHRGKRALFRRVVDSLKRGGTFINADQVAAPTETLEAEYVERWLDAVRAAGATEVEIEASLLRQREDRRASVEEQMTWMREAGLQEVDCWFKEGSFAVFVGRREE